MIHAAIQHLASQLGGFIKRTYGMAEEAVVVSNLVEADGSICSAAQNRLVLLLAGIEKETVVRGNNGLGGASLGRISQSGQPVHLNLRLMVAANYGGSAYAEGLRFLSAAVGFFQKNPVFERTNSPELPGQIQKLALEIENLDVQEASNLWSMLGGKYVPSMVYKVRLVTFDGNSLIAQLPAVAEPAVSLGSGYAG